MDDFEGSSYAPQSPDLSGFQTFDEPDPFSQNSYYPPQQQQQSYQPQQSYLPQPTNHDPFAFDQGPPLQNHNLYQPSMMPTNGRTKSSGSHEDDEYAPEPSSARGGSGRRSKKLKMEEEMCDKSAPGVDEGIEVKTKFPVARIKRIMQADDDVGKVAQVTPTAVSKALELFMISVVTKAANVARVRGSKRVTATHLKQAVENDEQLDFLKDIVSKVADAPTAKKEKEKEEDSEEGLVVKRKRAGTKRKKKEDDDF